MILLLLHYCGSTVSVHKKNSDCMIFTKVISVTFDSSKSIKHLNYAAVFLN